MSRLVIKPASPINDWSAWPHEVKDTLLELNRKGRLRFKKVPGADRDPKRLEILGVFECAYCCQLCQTHELGAACFEGKLYCDDCLVCLVGLLQDKEESDEY